MEVSTLIPKIIIFVTLTIPETTEADTHGAAVIILLQDLRVDKYVTLTLS